jgi:hypothetical protein
MGADLYLGKECEIARKYVEPLFDQAVKLRDKYQRGSVEAKVAQEMVSAVYDAMYPDSAYFRDSYNATSVLWTLGLSWWQDVKPNSRGNLSGKNLKSFRNRVAKAKQNLPTLEELKTKNVTIDDGENSVESWHKYYTEKRAKLLTFLDRAIKERKAIRCSL